MEGIEESYSGKPQRKYSKLKIIMKYFVAFRLQFVSIKDNHQVHFNVLGKISFWTVKALLLYESNYVGFTQCYYLKVYLGYSTFVDFF